MRATFGWRSFVLLSSQQGLVAENLVLLGDVFFEQVVVFGAVGSTTDTCPDVSRDIHGSIARLAWRISSEIGHPSSCWTTLKHVDKNAFVLSVFSVSHGLNVTKTVYHLPRELPTQYRAHRPYSGRDRGGPGVSAVAQEDNASWAANCSRNLVALLTHLFPADRVPLRIYRTCGIRGLHPLDKHVLYRFKMGQRLIVGTATSRPSVKAFTELLTRSLVLKTISRTEL